MLIILLYSLNFKNGTFKSLIYDHIKLLKVFTAITLSGLHNTRKTFVSVEYLTNRNKNGEEINFRTISCKVQFSQDNTFKNK